MEDQKEVVVPEKFQDLVSKIEKMSVLDLAELVKILEEKFGVSAAAPAMMMAAAAPAETDTLWWFRFVGQIRPRRAERDGDALRNPH